MSMSLESGSLSDALIERVRCTLKSVQIEHQDPQGHQFQGSGVVMCAGGYRHFTNAWITIRLLRFVGCRLPIQLWYFGESELDAKMRRIVSDLDVQCIDASEFSLQLGRNGSALKATAILRSPFKNVLYLDADNCVVRDPTYLFTLPEYLSNGALFWPSTRSVDAGSPLWKMFDFSYVDEQQCEVAQIIVNKSSCWGPLHMVEQLNISPEIGPFARDCNDLFWFAWRKCKKHYASPKFPPQMLTVPDYYGEATDAVTCQHDFGGERLFQHRLHCKWDLLGENPWVSGFLFEARCHEFLQELRHKWNGFVGRGSRGGSSERLRSCRKSLIDNVWILEIPKSLIEKIKERSNHRPDALEARLPDFVKLPKVGLVRYKDVQGLRPGLKAQFRRFVFARPKNPTSATEMRFSLDGTIKKGANHRVGYFWEIKEVGAGLELVLSTDSCESFRLKQSTTDVWNGKNGVRLRTVHTVYPHLVSLSESNLNQMEIKRSFGKQLHVGCSSEDLSDQILTTYACAGLSRLGVDVTFHTRFKEWLSCIAEPGLTITEKRYKSLRNVNVDFGNQIRHGVSRASWFAAALHPLLRPAKPTIKLAKITPRFNFDKYILLAPDPGSQNVDRGWPESSWARLAILLQDTGYEIVAIGSAFQSAAFLRTFSQTQAYWAVGNPPDWTIDALRGAQVLVGVNSEMIQLAALFAVRAVAIHSQLPGTFLWPGDSVRSVTPKTSCTFCRWQEERGFRSSCNLGCSALASITPEQVFEAVCKTIEQKEISFLEGKAAQK